MNPSDLIALPATELRRLIGARQLSPVELLDACIARIEAVNPLVNAVTATCFDRARAEARAATGGADGPRTSAIAAANSLARPLFRPTATILLRTTRRPVGAPQGRS